MFRRAAVAVLSLAALGATPQIAGAQDSGKVAPTVFEGDLSELAPDRSSGPAPREGRPALEPDGPAPAGAGGTARTPGDGARATASAPLVNFEGLRMTSGAPPDPTGEIGPNHFVEAINATRVAIYDRGGNTVAGPFDMSFLWGGVGLCGNNDDGDPIVMYDQLNDRWLLAQFAFTDADAGPWAMCVAVSRTADPVAGGWFAYELAMSALPDYEKFGIWRDGLYMTTFEGNNLGAFALDYAAMLAGASPAVIKRTVPTNDPSSNQNRFTRMLPADIDGEALNPAGEPNVMLRTVDADLTTSPTDVDRIELFEFNANFANPGSSSIVPVQALPTAPFDNSLCYDQPSPYRDCIPQLGTGTGIDPIAGRPMWRASYRNFGGFESIVFNQTVDVGADRAGIRWYELRRPAGGLWAIHQQGTYAPGSEHRWMGSMASNRLGELALGYSVSSSAIRPGVRYAGRVAADPPGELGPEQVLATGPESQTAFNRWGDYSHMSVDPLDDCTMWYVGEYGDRRSRIGAFQVSDCVPDTTIDGPAGETRVASFALASDEADASFQCSVDGAPFAPCPANFEPQVADGRHVLDARAVDVKGGIDPTPASSTFEVDTKGPEAKLARKAILRGNKLAVKVKCRGDDSCKGKLKVKKSKKSKRLSVRAGGAKKVKLKVKPAVDGGDKLKATLKVSDELGNPTKVAKKVKVKEKG